MGGGPVPLGPLGYEGAQHMQTLRPSVDGTRSKALRSFGVNGVTAYIQGNAYPT